ncbi:MAG: hypothetical protein AAF618_00010 [Pseudomonadota bacterium]
MAVGSAGSIYRARRGPRYDPRAVTLLSEFVERVMFEVGVTPGMTGDEIRLIFTWVLQRTLGNTGMIIFDTSPRGRLATTVSKYEGAIEQLMGLINRAVTGS